MHSMAKTCFCHPVGLRAGQYKTVAQTGPVKMSDRTLSHQTGVHKAFFLLFNYGVFGLLPRVLKIKSLYLGRYTLKKAVKRYYRCKTIPFYFPWFFLLLSVQSYGLDVQKDKEKQSCRVMFHLYPQNKFCFSRYEHPDPDLLTQVPDLTSKLPHWDGHAWWCRLLEKPDYYEQTGSAHPVHVLWDCCRSFSEELVLYQLYSYTNCASAADSDGSTVDCPWVKCDICPDSH